MTFWLTQQYPFVSKYSPGVWVRPGKEAAAKDLAKKDLVFIYETSRNTETGEGPGARAVILLVEITKRVHQIGKKWVRVANAKEKAKGKCPHGELLKIIGYKRIQSMGPKNSKLMKIDETIFDQIAVYFPKYKSNLSMSEAEAITAFGASHQEHGQEFASKEVREIIEKYSMEEAKKYFSARGFRVEDCHKTSPYDYKCIKDGEAFFLEVKGSTSSGSQILLTANEVRWMKLHPKTMKLFVLHSIQLTGVPTKLKASGGTTWVVEPWKLNLDKLVPIGYTYKLK